MEHAEDLLRTTFLSIKQVAFDSGMKDVSSFVREFKKKHGLTPSEFRAQSDDRKVRESPSKLSILVVLCC